MLVFQQSDCKHFRADFRPISRLDVEIETTNNLFVNRVRSGNEPADTEAYLAAELSFDWLEVFQ